MNLCDRYSHLKTPNQALIIICGVEPPIKKWGGANIKNNVKFSQYE